MKEYLLKIFGYRKARTKFATEKKTKDRVQYVSAGVPRQIIINKFTADQLLPVYSGDFCLSGQTEKCQYNFPSCACATICAIAEDFAITKEHNQGIGIDWQPMWKHMIEMGIAGSAGSYLQDNIWYLQNIGAKDNYGRTWVIDKLEKINKKDIDKFLKAGHQIYTGSAIKFPMVDRNFVFSFGVSAGGHAYRTVGKHEGLDLMETTWKDFGYKKESQFFMKESDRKNLFSCYAMTFKIVE